ncbi:MAG: HD domain-containing protein [Desulfovibrio sp.]|nr:HD domain-containing protein [Desulfovibrio sp.]
MIGISDNRMKHILGVSRKAYALAKERGHDETFARKMFAIGWMHDIGYAFSEQRSEHQEKSAELLALIGGMACREGSAYLAVKNHGRLLPEMTEEDIILNMADMLVDPKGADVTAEERLAELRDRFGEHSPQYREAKAICQSLGLM